MQKTQLRDDTWLYEQRKVRIYVSMLVRIMDVKTKGRSRFMHYSSVLKVTALFPYKSIMKEYE